MSLSTPLVPTSLGVAAFLACITIAASARAADPPDKAACAHSYEQAQRHRQAHELKAAKGELLVCARTECPAWVKRDCVPWLGQVEASMPSVIFVARNAGVTARSDLHATLDGAAVADPLGGASIALDPGEHVILFEANGFARSEQRFTLREGERDRRVELTLVPLPAAAPIRPESPPALPPPPAPPTPTSRTSARDPAETDRPVSPLVYGLGGTGLVLFGLGLYFQGSGMAERSELSHCAPRCRSSDVDTAQRTLWAGNIMLGAAVVAVGAAVWFFVTRPSVTIDPRR